MTKYSTGDSDNPDPSDESASCTMCGATENLQRGEVAGAEVIVCSSCADGQDKSSGSQDKSSDTSSNTNEYQSNSSSQQRSNSETSGYTITNPDSSWVEDDRPDYGNATTPYLANGYAKDVATAMKENDIKVEDIAEETGLNADTVQAVLDGNAVSAGVSSDAIMAIEKFLDVDIMEDF